MSEFDFDFLIIGSGFGGAVSAMRLSQKGYRVGVIEEGRLFQNTDFPKSSWDLKNFLWVPILKFFGIQKISLLKKVMILHGAGVGGGSLVYANTLMVPDSTVFEKKDWPEGPNWTAELTPHYEMAKKMLGVTQNPFLAEHDLAIKKLGDRMKVSDTFHPTDVGIYFGEYGVTSPDPYFSGDGPARTGCVLCGSCMIGCPNGAKNTLDKNYLYFAKKWGAQIFSMQSVLKIKPLQNGGYEVETQRTDSMFTKKRNSFKAKKVVLSAGVIGTLKLLFLNKEIYKTLKNISSTIGENVRTNGESLMGATSLDRNVDMSHGIAIGAAIHPDCKTKIEGCRYPSGSNLMRLLAVPLTGDGNLLIRPLKLLFNLFYKLPSLLKVYSIWDWAKQTIILLVMQSDDSKMKLKIARGWLSRGGYKLKGESTEGAMPSYIPIAQKAAIELSKQMNGVPQNVLTEVLFATPATAHIMGGVPMGSSANNSVIGLNHEVHNYPGLFVSDASVIPANLGVNPSLTVTAMTERFCSLIPENPDALPNFRAPVIRFGKSE